jgi:signal transduction histidine kinase
MLTPLNALLVEDSAPDADLLVVELKKNGFDPKWERVETEMEYRASLNPGLNIIFSDYSLPQFSTARAIELLQESGLDVPFIIVSGTIGEERAVEALKAGATDCVLKDNLNRIGPVVKRALREIQERDERKRLETQFVEAQKMEVIGQLAGGIAHDFNNIISVINGYSDLIMSELEAGSLSHKCAEEICLAADRASALVGQLLIFGRKQAVQMLVINLNDVLGNLDKMLRRLIDENIEMTMIQGEHIGHIKADSGYVGQVLMNLIVNARDAMPNGGKLVIETGNAKLDENFAQAHAGATVGDYVVLTISDSGIGMSDEVKACIFQPFFTTKPKGKGTGLGLTTCQTIVKQCGGCIDVQSELGKGTTFKIFFPRVVQPLDIAVRPAKAKPPARGTETLLFVDDEPSMCHMARRILELQGYKVLSAINGKEGLRAVRECKGDRVSLVVTDVIMPEMDGKMMAKALKLDYPDIKVLFTSGYNDEVIVQQEGLDPGAVFLPKPYTAASLTQKVRELLDAKNNM